MQDIQKDLIRIKQISSIRKPNQSSPIDFSTKTAMLTIDVFGVTPYRAWLFANEIEDILFNALPNTSTRIKKTNGTDDSAISTFDRLTLDWNEIGAFENIGIVYQLTSEFGCNFIKNKS